MTSIAQLICIAPNRVIVFHTFLCRVCSSSCHVIFNFPSKKSINFPVSSVSVDQIRSLAVINSFFPLVATFFFFLSRLHFVVVIQWSVIGLICRQIVLSNWPPPGQIRYQQSGVHQCFFITSPFEGMRWIRTAGTAGWTRSLSISIVHGLFLGNVYFILYQFLIRIHPRSVNSSQSSVIMTFSCFSWCMEVSILVLSIFTAANFNKFSNFLHRRDFGEVSNCLRDHETKF